MPWMSIFLIEKMAIESSFRFHLGLTDLSPHESYWQLLLFWCRYKRWRYLSIQLNLDRSSKLTVIRMLIVCLLAVRNPRDAIRLIWSSSKAKMKHLFRKTKRE